MFQKGVSGNPAGRPKGSKDLDRLNYLDLQIWFKKMFETLDDVDKASERMNFALQVADKLLSKIANLPMSPEESAANAKARQEMLNDLENGQVPGIPSETNEHAAHV